MPAFLLDHDFGNSFSGHREIIVPVIERDLSRCILSLWGNQRRTSVGGRYWLAFNANGATHSI